MTSRSLLGVVAVVLVAGGAFLASRAWSRDAEHPASEAGGPNIQSGVQSAAPAGSSTPSSAKDASPPVPSASPESAVLDTAAVESLPEDQRLYMPDGSALPALNGATGLVRKQWWPGNRPWSPIKSKITTPDGVEWYVHEDGSRSTTRMVFRSDLGRKDAHVTFLSPGDPVPLLREDAPSKTAR